MTLYIRHSSRRQVDDRPPSIATIPTWNRDCFTFSSLSYPVDVVSSSFYPLREEREYFVREEGVTDFLARVRVYVCVCVVGNSLFRLPSFIPSFPRSFNDLTRAARNRSSAS